jgi:alpha-1,3-rhamnosyl/mannosyltransferase
LARSHAARADAVMVSSHYAAAEVMRELQIPPARVHVCPPGQPSWAADVREQRRTVAPAHILFLGTLMPRKNVGTLLDAYAQLRSAVPDAPQLWLAGHSTPAAAAWEARCRRPPLQGHVRLHGYVDEVQRRRLYASARMLVLPSYEEGFGLPVLEAMACGVPVVVSSRGSLPEVAGDAARPVDPDNVDALAAEMRSLLDADVASAAAARGLAQAARYSWAACADAARRAYASAMETHAHRG